MPERIAFIGTGVMGAPMAGHLLAAGHALTVHNRTPEKAYGLVARGAKLSSSPAEAARDADVVFINVRDTPDVLEVCLGEHGVLRTVRRGTVVVDHSTISPAAAREVAERLAGAGADFLDAPVTGGDVGARAGTLSIMVGGTESAFERVLPLLRLMGRTITHTGPVGTGQLTKLVNQILVSVTNLATCEALAFAAKNGLNLEKTLEAVSGGAGGSWQLSNLGPKMLAGDFRPGFTIDLQQKDLRLVLEAAERAQVSLLATSLVHQLFSAAQAAGFGHEGTQALFKVVDGLSNRH
ncbi:MAG: NAD(P)-dependent oxidoreductase [Tepidisphaerales bacterium]